MILEIGQIEGKVAEVEYPIDNLRLDVVWKTITAGNPKWAFEVQMGGNFYEALTKLKHAWDKWNSKPFLVTTDPYVAQAKALLEGSFHEMREDARIANWEKIVKLHQLLKEAHKIKSEIRF
jgi:methionyl-tRNA formyltransferase